MNYKIEEYHGSISPVTDRSKYAEVHQAILNMDGRSKLRIGPLDDDEANRLYASVRGFIVKRKDDLGDVTIAIRDKEGNPAFRATQKFLFIFR